MQGDEQGLQHHLAQHGHQAQAVSGHLDELQRLIRQQLIEAVTLLGVVGHPCAHQGHQTEPFLLDQACEASLQLEVPQHLEGPLCHLQGIGQTQDPTIRLALQGERVEAMAGQMGLDSRHRLLITGLGQHLEFDEGYLIHRGDDARPAGARCPAQYVGAALVRVVAAAQGEALAAVGHRLQGAGMEHGGAEAGQLVGLRQAQAFQQARLLHPARIGAVDTGHVAPDGGGLPVRQGGQQAGAVVGAVATEQQGAPLHVGGDEAGHHYAAGVLRQAGLEQLAGDGGIDLDQGAILGAQEAAGVEPDGLVAATGEQGGQQARRPHLAKGQQAVALEAIKLPFQGLGDLLHVVGQLLAQVEQQLPLQQAVDQALLVGVQGSDGFARGLVTRLGQLHQLDQPVGGLAGGGDHHQLSAPALLLGLLFENAGDPAIADRIRQTAAAKLVHMTPLQGSLCRHRTLSLLLLFHYFTCSACCANCACSKP
ncbi:hypothetical protein D3C78_509130 [compost metagenome]